MQGTLQFRHYSGVAMQGKLLLKLQLQCSVAVQGSPCLSLAYIHGSAQVQFVVHLPLKGKSTVILPQQAIFKNFSPIKVGGNGSLFTPATTTCTKSSWHIFSSHSYLADTSKRKQKFNASLHSVSMTLLLVHQFGILEFNTIPTPLDCRQTVFKKHVQINHACPCVIDTCAGLNNYLIKVIASQKRPHPFEFS